MYAHIFKNEFLLSIPETFLCITCLLLLLYGVLFFRTNALGEHVNHVYAARVSERIAERRSHTIGDNRIDNLMRDTSTSTDGTLEQASGAVFNPSTVSRSTSTIAPILLYNVSLLVVYAFMLTLVLLWNQPVEHTIFFFYSFATDELSYYLKTLVLLGSIASILMSLQYFEQEQMNAFEYVIFIAFATLSILLLMSAYDLLSVYLTIELQSLAFYSLAACSRESEFSTEAGVKYFMLGALSSGILLFGISLVYGSTGITQLGELAIFLQGVDTTVMQEGIQQDNLIMTDTSHLGILFIIVALLFKITAAPFHIWAADVYEGAPTSVTALFSIIPKIGVTAVLLRIASALGGSFSGESVFSLLVFSGMISTFLGGLAGIAQRKIKRLLAFSSIAHVGYILLGISCGTLEGYQASVLYLLVYTLITIASFTVILSLSTQGVSLRLPTQGTDSLTHQKGIQQQGVRRIRYIADLHGLGRSNPVLALSFTVVLFSLAGIPPFAGFFSKLSIFFATMSTSMYTVSCLGVCATCISSFYYLRMVRTLFFGHMPSSDVRVILKTSAAKGRRASMLLPPKIDAYKASILAICVFFLVFFFVYPSPLYSITYKIALHLR